MKKTNPPAKNNTGSRPPKGKVPPPKPEGEIEIALQYNENILALLPQNYRTGYIFFELDQPLRERMAGLLKGTAGQPPQLVLRMCGISHSGSYRSPDFFQDFAVLAGKSAFYLKIPRPDYTYQAVLGLLNSNGDFYELLSSIPVHFPRNFAIWSQPVHFRDLAGGQGTPQKRAGRKTLGLDQIEARLKTKGTPPQESTEPSPSPDEIPTLIPLSPPPHPGEISPVSSADIPLNPRDWLHAPSSAEFFPGASENIPIGPLPFSAEFPSSQTPYERLTAEFPETLPSSFELPSSAEFAPSSAEFAGPQTQPGIAPEGPNRPPLPAEAEGLALKDMFLIAATELRVYGRTNPDAILEINGTYFPTRPDGSFSIEMALPDSDPRFEIVAKRKGMWRKITKQVNKRSKREGFENE